MSKIDYLLILEYLYAPAAYLQESSWGGEFLASELRVRSELIVKTRFGQGMRGL